MILYLCYNSTDPLLSKLDQGYFKVFFCENVYTSKVYHQKDEEEYFADKFASSLDRAEFENIKTVVIDKNLGAKDWNRAVLLLGHIRLHHYLNNTLNKAPVILTSTVDIQINELSDLPIKNVFGIEGISFLKHEDIFNLEQNLSTGKSEYAINRFLRRNSIESIEGFSFDIPYKFDDRHQISNEWGAINLARNAGYDDAETDYDYPPTLYFKYLTKKYKAHTCTATERKEIVREALPVNNPAIQADSLLPDGKLDFSNYKYLKNKRILLIDDNADKGWKNTLSLLFKSTIDVFSNLLDIKLNNYNTYDIVFLDLYMPNPKKDGKTDMAYTVNILKELKVKFPGIPIIVFTASNKSWTMHEVLEKGADGIYVKESPEYAADPEFSKENFKSFAHTVINCLEKYTVLRPYWEAIQSITNDDYFNSLPEKQNTKFKGRIAERLEMFYGLLKKGFQQRQYDKDRFHFSDYELAFMTMWSALNEISEIYYDKIDRTKFTIKDLNGKVYQCQPIPFKNWKLINSDKYLLKYDFTFESFNDDGSPNNQPGSNTPKLLAHNPQCFIVRNEGAPFYQLGYTDRKEASREISLQIAFILLVKFNISENHPMFSTLRRLNLKRNHLYLTHGAFIKDGFYSFLEVNKRKETYYNITPTGDIKDLFELVAFLLKGKELTVNI